MATSGRWHINWRSMRYWWKPANQANAGLLARSNSNTSTRFTELSTAWRRLSLVKRFALVSSAVVLLGMLTIGFWVSREIEHGVTQYSAATAALYVDGMIAPLAQDLANKNKISKESAAKVDSIIMKQTQSGSRIVAVKLWKRDGIVAYSTWKDLIGKRFKPTENLKLAWSGIVTSEYDHVTHEYGAIERNKDKPLLEVYAPILSNLTGEIIAVSEFYISADGLEEQLSAAAFQTWLVVGTTTAAMVLALFGLVYGANATIERQKQAMQRQIVSLEVLVDQNRQLSQRLRRSHIQSSTTHEHLLRRLGSDLHDGPAQLLGLALMRLDSLFDRPSDISQSDRDEDASTSPVALEIVRGSLRDAMSEIRNLSSGFALPQLDRMSLEDVVLLVLRNHEKRTSTKVDLRFQTNVGDVSISAKECIYRFVQEALNNSYRHADGQGQKISVSDIAGCLVVQASDNGPGFQAASSSMNTGALGLTGLRGRVEALGGELAIASVAGRGAVLTARFVTGQISNQELVDA